MDQRECRWCIVGDWSGPHPPWCPYEDLRARQPVDIPIPPTGYRARLAALTALVKKHGGLRVWAKKLNADEGER